MKEPVGGAGGMPQSQGTVRPDQIKVFGTDLGNGAIQVADEGVIQVFEEQLKISKRLVEGEGARVRVVTDQVKAPANVTLRSERIEVERVAVGRMVESAPPVREENGVTIIPVMEEVVVTEVRLVLKEELHVRRVAETREHQETVLLRRQRAEVERLPATGRPVDQQPPNSNKDQPR